MIYILKYQYLHFKACDMRVIMVNLYKKRIIYITVTKSLRMIVKYLLIGFCSGTITSFHKILPECEQNLSTVYVYIASNTNNKTIIFVTAIWYTMLIQQTM